jgi:hypothetical protein
VKNPHFGYSRLLWIAGGLMVVSGLALTSYTVALIVAGLWVMAEAVLINATERRRAK